MILPHRHSFPGKSGFTLIELLVAAAISMLLVVLLLMAAQGITGNYTATRNRILRGGDAALALDQMVQDIEGMVVPNFPSGEGLMVSGDSPPPGDATNAVWLSLLSSATDADTSEVPFPGAARAVSYRIAHQNPMDNTESVPAVYALYRSISSAAHAFRNIGTNTTNLQAQYWNSIPPSPSPAPRAPTDRENFLAENVVDFQVRFQRADDLQWTRPGQEVRIGRDGSTVDGVPVEGGFRRVEVSVTVLSPEGAKRLEQGVVTLKEAIERYGKTSVRQTAGF